MHLIGPYQQWYQVFEWLEWIIDLPHLNLIKLGENALEGRDVESCSLQLECDIDMNEMMNRSS